MNVSFSEILVVLLIALLVLKPEQLPEVASAVGRMVRWAKRLLSDAKEEMRGLIEHTEQSPEQTREKK